MTLNNIPESDAEVFTLAITLAMREVKCNLDEAIDRAVRAWQANQHPENPELCGDCSIPWVWSIKLNRYTCNRCGA